VSEVCEVCGCIICEHEPPCFNVVAAHAWFDEDRGIVVILCPDCLEEIEWRDDLRPATDEEVEMYLSD